MEGAEGSRLSGMREIIGRRPPDERARSQNKRESRSSPHVGIVTMRGRGLDQRRDVVIEFKCAFMVSTRGTREAAGLFPGTDAPWTV